MMGWIWRRCWRTMLILPADLGSLADAVGKRLVGAEVALLSFDSRNPPCK